MVREARRVKQNTTLVTDALGLQGPTIRAWIAKSRLPRLNLGRAVGVLTDAIVEFLERNIIPAKDERSGRIA
jgi:hypothetical protein